LDRRCAMFLIFRLAAECQHSLRPRPDPVVSPQTAGGAMEDFLETKHIYFEVDG
jgi:hypothetical protein